MAEFFVGQKVVCIHDTYRDGTPTPLRRGHQYVIKKIAIETKGRGPFGSTTGHLVVDVAGIINSRSIGRPADWDIRRFRPLEETPAIVSWARQICRDVEEEDRVRRSLEADADRFHWTDVL